MSKKKLRLSTPVNPEFKAYQDVINTLLKLNAKLRDDLVEATRIGEKLLKQKLKRRS